MSTIVIFNIFTVLLTSCCNTGCYLANKQKTFQDFAGSTECQCFITCGVSSVGVNRYTYNENSEESRFIYEISISGNERSSVRLNSFSLTNSDNTPIIVKYYVETYTKAATNTVQASASFEEHADAYKEDSLSTKIDELTWELDSFPILLRESGEGKAHSIRIIAETNEPYSKVEGLKVHYDFEVGENRYISNNIEYKWRRYWDCRPKIW